MNIPPRLADLQDQLQQGIRLSKQGGYRRRMPADESRPLLQQVQHELCEYARRYPESEMAWRLLSQAAECLLDYRTAIEAHERAMVLSATQRKEDLKRRAALQQALVDWEQLPLSGEQLAALGRYLADRDIDSSNRTLQLTAQWLRENVADDADEVLQRLRNCGGVSDFTVLYNVVR